MTKTQKTVTFLYIDNKQVKREKFKNTTLCTFAVTKIKYLGINKLKAKQNKHVQDLYAQLYKTKKK